MCNGGLPRPPTVKGLGGQEVSIVGLAYLGVAAPRTPQHNGATPFGGHPPYYDVHLWETPVPRGTGAGLAGGSGHQDTYPERPAAAGRTEQCASMPPPHLLSQLLYATIWSGGRRTSK